MAKFPGRGPRQPPIAMPTKSPKTPKPLAKPVDDVVLVHAPTEDGKGLQVLRKRGDTLSAGEVRPVEEGKPLTGELVRLKPREEMPALCDVEVLYGPDGAESKGPAQVATDEYRAGWAAIWGKKKAEASSRTKADPRLLN